MDQRRTGRVSEAVREELSEIIGFETDDPRLLATWRSLRSTSVPDMRHAACKSRRSRGTKRKQRQSLKALEHAAGYLRHEMATRLACRQIPELHFDPGSQPRRRKPDRFLLSGRKKLMAAMKINPKNKQIVIVLFLFACFGPRAGQAAERAGIACGSEASVEAMGSAYSIVAYDEDRYK